MPRWIDLYPAWWRARYGDEMEAKRPVILVGHSTGGLDALLYARTYPSDIDGLVLVDAPSESAPQPPYPLDDGNTKLDFSSGLRKLRHAGSLGDLPIILLSHGQRAFSTDQAERSWTRMQRELAHDSSDTLRVVALKVGIWSNFGNRSWWRPRSKRWRPSVQGNIPPLRPPVRNRTRSLCRLALWVQ